MASKRRKAPLDKKTKAGIIGGAAALVLFFLIFGIGSLRRIIIGVGVSALIGWIVSVMSTGLDVSKPAPDQHQEIVPQTGNEKADQMIVAGQDLMREIRKEMEQRREALAAEAPAGGATDERG